jgi:hypothetical protein
MTRKEIKTIDHAELAEAFVEATQKVPPEVVMDALTRLRLVYQNAAPALSASPSSAPASSAAQESDEGHSDAQGTTARSR